MGTCALRGKELGVEGVRGGFDLRKDTTILPAPRHEKNGSDAKKLHCISQKKFMRICVAKSVWVMG
jgi:hypothetical protein